MTTAFRYGIASTLVVGGLWATACSDDETTTATTSPTTTTTTTSSTGGGGTGAEGGSGGDPNGGAGGVTGGNGGDGGEGNCARCGEVVMQTASPADLCASSAAKFGALTQCTCVDSCSTECADTICSQMPPPSAACIQCRNANCATQFGECINDGMIGTGGGGGAGGAGGN